MARCPLASIAFLLFALPLAAGAADAPPSTRPAADDQGWIKLFPEAGVPKGWVVRAWDDVSKPPARQAVWRVDDQGVLHGAEPRLSWLVSEAEYGDFILDFEFKLPERGNSGCGLRFPAHGDPAFDGLEVQMADERYNDGRDGPDKLTGSIYKALAPTKQVYKPLEWNRYTITCRGSRITVVLNGQTIQDVDLDRHAEPIERHNGQPAPALKDRPRKGHIGFQELSRGGDGAHVMIRNARLKALDAPAAPTAPAAPAAPTPR